MKRLRSLVMKPRAAGALLALVGATALAAIGATPALAQGGPFSFSPQVIHTGEGPTGYSVTFRYRDPTATSVLLRGEWYFSNPATTTITTSDGLLPTQWAPGDFPIAYPNQGPAPNWPVQPMTLNKATGVWSYTTPLPSGTFTYGFYVNCSDPTGSTCTEISDPSNPPWNFSGSVEPTSQVYVPYDPYFGNQDLTWEAPPSKLMGGTLMDLSYPDPLSTSPVGSHPVAVWLPPGYDAHRAIPYPTLYLSHGGGGNEVDWSTQGVAQRIIANLLTARKVQPMVIVMPEFNNLGTCAGINIAPCYAQDIVQNVIPFINANFNVSQNQDDRAFAGLSLGGYAANYLLFNDTTTFGYYGSWSIGQFGAPPTTDPAWQNPALKNLLGLQIGGGKFDSLTIGGASGQPGIAQYEANLAAAGIPYTNDLVTGGHEWYTWRQLLYDYATMVAFRTTTTTVSATPRVIGARLTAQVVADTHEPAPVMGTVQFYVNGNPLGQPRPVLFGHAVLTLGGHESLAGQSVTATYSGDTYYNGSTSAPLVPAS